MLLTLNDGISAQTALSLMKNIGLFDQKGRGNQTLVPVCSFTAIPAEKGIEFTVQRKAVHLNQQLMALARERSPLEQLHANRETYK